MVSAGIIAALAAATALPIGPVAAAKPQRIMSMSLCADLLLLQLVPRERVASVTYLTPDAAAAVIPGGVHGLAINYGTAEDILKFRPDLILAGDYSTPVTRRLAKRVGAPLIEVATVNDFAGVRAVVRQVARAVGEPGKGEALVARMDADLAQLASRPLARTRRVVAWSGGTSIPGKGSLPNTIIEAAGAVNIAAAPGAASATFGIEQLLMADPDALLFGAAKGDRPSLVGLEGKHRVVRRAFAGRSIAYNEVVFSCGLPQSATAAVDLRRALDRLPVRR